MAEVELLYELLESLLWRDNIPAVVEGGAQHNLLLHQLKQRRKIERKLFWKIVKVIKSCTLRLTPLWMLSMKERAESQKLALEVFLEVSEDIRPGLPTAGELGVERAPVLPSRQD